MNIRPAIISVTLIDGTILYHNRGKLTNKPSTFKSINHALKTGTKLYRKQLGYTLICWSVDEILLNK